MFFLQSVGDDERARLPEFLTELDLASLEASEEDIEALKTVVKRLAPEKNGEYQVYQGFYSHLKLTRLIAFYIFELMSLNLLKAFYLFSRFFAPHIYRSFLWK